MGEGRGREGLHSGTSDNGHSEEWTTSLPWENCSAPAYIFSTSEEGTTSEQCSSPMCPLFRGSTVERERMGKENEQGSKEGISKLHTLVIPFPHTRNSAVVSGSFDV